MSLPHLMPDKLFDVHGLVVVVTGGGTGIGLMIARTLECNGAVVYIIGRRKEVLEKAAKASTYGNIIPLQGDVTSRADLLNAVETIKAQRGYINILVNNAGVAYNKFATYEPAADIKAFQERLWSLGAPEDWTKTFEINVTAVYYTTVAFLELLHIGNLQRTSLNAPTSQVITMSSVGGFRRDDRVFSLSYGVSKAAVTHLGKSLANVLKNWKIRSNIIAPGIYPSEMTDGLVSLTNVSADAVPLQRNGDIEDMGGLILFLASRAGAYVNGGVHLTDGGRLGLFSSTY